MKLMKRVGFFLTAAFCLALVGTSVSAQTTYTWNQTGSAAWTTPTNWTPTRTTPAVDDILVFNNGATTTATAVPTQTVGQLSVSANTNVTLQAAAAVTLTIAGGTGTDLSVAAGSSLSCNVANAITISLSSGATGSIGGSVSLSTAAHRLLAADASGITFNSGGTFTEGTAFLGNPFGTTSLNSIIFANGSTFVFLAGSNPFGAGAPNSVVIFQSGSLYKHQSTNTPSVSGRTYANFELDLAGTISVTGASAFVVDNFTITQGTFNYNVTGTPGHSIKGNISVAGTLNFNPASAGTVNLNGASAQTISGAGTLTINAANQTVVINNSNGITLSRDVTLNNGTFNFTLGNITTGINTLIIGSAETVNRTSGHVIGNLRKTFAAAANKTFEVGTANGYSPVDVNITAGTFPTDVTISTTQGPPPVVDASKSIQRYWTLTGTNLTADLAFHYNLSDVMGTEANYKVIRISGGTAVSFPTSTVDTIGHVGTLNGATNFTADWTVGEPLAPTTANGVVTGRIIDQSGNPVEGAVVRLQGTQNRKFITDANGVYRFDNVETSGFYTVTPSRANYTFSPSIRSFSQIGATTEAAFGATLTSGGFVNPLDTPEYFVRQHYIDFLGREPDESGFNFWSDQIIECGPVNIDQNCIERRRENVSAAYFLSIEFQQTGGLVDGLYRASYGVRPEFAQFMPDTRTVGLGVVVGTDDWESKLQANKEAFVAAFVNRPAFHQAYDGMDNSLFIDTLIGHTGVTFITAERDALVSGLTAGTMTRAEALRSITENSRFVNAKFNEVFVMMQYFGYLRRDPDESGYQFWLNKLNQFDGNFERAEMVKAFIVSSEYRARFR
jgi:Carboxypeptidase regulatory-like domain/Domain of unknown function (DUF4214)